MALKGDRQVDSVTIDYFFNGTAEAGVTVCKATAGSGIAMDAVENVAYVASSASGQVPLGVLLQEVVNIDLSRQHINWHKDQAASGDKVTILTKGWVVTDQVEQANAGSGAELSANGKLRSSPQRKSVEQEHVNPTVGRFRSNKDQFGFAKVYIDLA